MGNSIETTKLLDLVKVSTDYDIMLVPIGARPYDDEVVLPLTKRREFYAVLKDVLSSNLERYGAFLTPTPDGKGGPFRIVITVMSSHDPSRAAGMARAILADICGTDDHLDSERSPSNNEAIPPCAIHFHPIKDAWHAEMGSKYTAQAAQTKLAAPRTGIAETADIVGPSGTVVRFITAIPKRGNGISAPEILAWFVERWMTLGSGVLARLSNNEYGNA